MKIMVSPKEAKQAERDAHVKPSKKDKSWAMKRPTKHRPYPR